MEINAHSFITALKSVLPFAAKNDVRHFLNGVHLLRTDGGLFIEATCGHCAARVKIDAEVAEPLDLVMPVDYCEKLTKLKVPARVRNVRGLSLLYTAKDVLVAHDGQTVASETVDCKYPSLDYVLLPPKTGTTPTARGVNPEYLAKAAKSATLLTEPRCKIAELVGGAGPTDNFYFEVATNHGAFLSISEPAVFIIRPMKILCN